MADRLFTQADLDAARAETRAATEAEMLPFQGVDTVVFPRDRPHFAACRLYETQLHAYRGHVAFLLQDARTAEEFAAEDDAEVDRRAAERVGEAAGANRVSTAVKRTTARARGFDDRQRSRQRFDYAIRVHHDRRDLLEDLDRELVAVRRWLDAHVDEADAYREDRPGLRREGAHLAGLPSFTTAAFIADDPSRLEHERDDRPGGGMYGQSWTWEPPELPGQVTKWAVYQLDNGEIYASDNTHGADPSRSALREEILLLGRVPRALFSSSDHFLMKLQVSVRHGERNTLALVADAVAEQERLARERPPASFRGNVKP